MSKEAFGKKSYWDDRFNKEGGQSQYDWYCKYSQIKVELSKWLKKTDSILVIGCGNSRLTEELHANEYENITSIDWSSVVIKQMSERTMDRPTLAWKTMDVVEKLDFPLGHFDVVLDKGCLDTVLCSENAINAVYTALLHIHTVCRGMFILISNWGPEKWQTILEMDVFNWVMYAIPISPAKDDGLEVWMFVLLDKSKAIASSQA